MTSTVTIPPSAAPVLPVASADRTTRALAGP
jgi:hypothetical protein